VTYPVSLAIRLQLTCEQLAAEKTRSAGAAQVGRAVGVRADALHPDHRLPGLATCTASVAAGDPVAFAGMTGLMRRRALA